jgi:hypothetical protein
MVERLMLFERDATPSEGVASQMKKWGGRLALGGIIAVYARESARYISGNNFFPTVEEDIHHEYKETPEDYEL